MNKTEEDLKYYKKKIKRLTPNQVRIIEFWRVRGFNVVGYTLGLNVTLNPKPQYQSLGLSLQYLEQFEQEAIRLTAKEIFEDLETSRQKEVKKLKKYDDANWKKGNKTDGRKSIACVLTRGINVRNLINNEKKKWIKDD